LKLDIGIIGQERPGGLGFGEAYGPEIGYVTISRDPGGARETRPKNVSVQFIIKYKQI
jgi:hypothetical protein